LFVVVRVVVPYGVDVVLRVVVVPLGDVVVVVVVLLWAKLMPHSTATEQTNPISFFIASSLDHWMLRVQSRELLRQISPRRSRSTPTKVSPCARYN
jgi:hypothetical protein